MYVTGTEFLITSYGIPLAQRASYLALHSSCQMVQLIYHLPDGAINLSPTVLTLCKLGQDVFPMAHT